MSLGFDSFTVSELIDQLQALPPDAPVWYYVDKHHILEVNEVIVEGGEVLLSDKY